LYCRAMAENRNFAKGAGRSPDLGRNLLYAACSGFAAALSTSSVRVQVYRTR
jgi:hypothetical protein